MRSQKIVLPIIVVSQFLSTSVWFAGNSVLPDLIHSLNAGPGFLAPLTSAIQLGFIAGTFLFALFAIADRFSPSVVFFVSGILAALFNAGIILNDANPEAVLALRFLTGFFLAGIYPVGMKIASDYYQSGLGKSLGFLVGALVMGTAFPHFLKFSTAVLPWKYVIITTSLLACLGGLLIFLLVPNGPYRKPGQKLVLTEFAAGFRQKQFRSAAFGYFGHMWELYAFWAFVPVMLNAWNIANPTSTLNVSLFSFLIIGSGGLSCAFGGLISFRFGARTIATWALVISGMCCLLSPVFLYSGSVVAALLFLFVWGLSVVADSPMFSTLVAQSAPETSRGTSLTIVNCIGFSITIAGIQFISFISDKLPIQYVYMLLALGPLLGLVGMSKELRIKN